MTVTQSCANQYLKMLTVCGNLTCGCAIAEFHFLLGIFCWKLGYNLFARWRSLVWNWSTIFDRKKVFVSSLVYSCQFHFYIFHLARLHFFVFFVFTSMTFLGTFTFSCALFSSFCLWGWLKWKPEFFFIHNLLKQKCHRTASFVYLVSIIFMQVI